MSKSRPSRFKETCAVGRQKRLSPTKWLFYRFSVKTVADGRRHTAYHNKYRRRAF